MSHTSIYTIFIILLLGGYIFWKMRGSGGNRINPADVKKRLDTANGIILLDVRNREEYLGKHIPKSVLIPVNILENEAEKRLPDKAAEIYVYCASGSRSSMAVRILTKLGYTNIHDLGGIFRWPYETVSGNK